MTESESLFIVAQNNAIRVNYLKEKINNTQMKSKCRLCDNKDKILNNII